MVMIAWHKPNLPSREDTAFQMLKAILADGRTSRFYMNLVEGRKIASSVSADPTGVGERYPNLLIVWGETRAPHAAAALEAGFLEEIERIKREPPTAWEMDKVRNQLSAGLVKSLDSNMGMAQYQLGMTALNLGQFADAVTALEAYLKVDPNGPKAAEVKASLPALQGMVKK